MTDKFVVGSTNFLDLYWLPGNISREESGDGHIYT